ncbi:hypothetical protein HK100_004790 [Physocladia obscura]|uniref:Uncharacterized protein n=1 Tax=Physocladia obscura TaxID=109957 RepID=A0AAD5XFN4_9FUNG|nr:hypothetical protein HK100_004790 [Physocladia obscura]
MQEPELAETETRTTTTTTEAQHVKKSRGRVMQDFYFASCGWSPDGSCLLAMDSRRTLRLVNTPASLYYGGSNSGGDVLLSSAGCEDGGGEEALVVPLSDAVHAWAWHPRMQSTAASAEAGECVVAVAQRDHPVQLVDAYTGRVQANYSHSVLRKGDATTAPHALAFAFDANADDGGGASRLLAGLDGAIAVLDLRRAADRDAVRVVAAPSGLIAALAATPHAPTLVAAASFARAWAVHDWRASSASHDACCWRVRNLPGSGATHVAWCPVDPNRLVVTSRRSNLVQVYDLRYVDDSSSSSPPLFSLNRCPSKPNHPGSNQRLSFSISPDGCLLATGDQLGNFHVFDLYQNPGSIIASTNVSNEAVGSASFHPYYTYPPAQNPDDTSADADKSRDSNINNDPPAMKKYFIATCSGERQDPTVSDYSMQDLSSSDSSDTDNDGNNWKKYLKGMQAELAILFNLERPKASIQIYNVASSTPSQEQIFSLATTLLNDRGTGVFERNYCVDYLDRLDIYGLTVSSNLSTEEKVEKCIQHQKAEIAVRNIADGKEWFIQKWESVMDYRRFLVVIDTKEEEWEEKGMLFVWWEKVERERDEDEIVPEVKITRIKGKQNLGEELSDVRVKFNIQWGHLQYEEASEGEEILEEEE